MGRQAARRIFIQALPLLLALSCALSPVPDKTAPDYSLLKREELASWADTDPEASLEALSLISLSGIPGFGMDQGSMGNIASSAASKLSARLEAEIKAGDWKGSDKTLSSLRAVKAFRNPAFSEAVRAASALDLDKAALDIHMGRAGDLFRSGLYAPAAAHLHKALDILETGLAEGRKADSASGGTRSGVLPVPEYDMLAEWFGRASSGGDSETANRILSMLSQTGAAKLRGSWDPRVKNIGEKAAGVVTVYVDKGLRMENGVGYPDRVLGTAFQVDAKGYYLTNYHVVSSEVDPKYNGYSRLSIRPSSNPSARIPAKVVGWDEDLDLALLKSQEISSHTFYPFLRGKTAKGQRIYAVGSPVGLENSVTAGIVSATGRRILPRGEAIQIDAPVNPGSSGGPLLDEEGNLAGVIFAGLPGFQGLNFALPVEWVLGLYPALFEGGKVQSSWLGAGIAKNLDSSMDISYVFAGKRGLKAGDRLISLDGTGFTEIQEAQMLIASKPVGSLCAVEIERGGERAVILVRTEAVPHMPFKKAPLLDAPEMLLGGATGMLLEHVSGPRGSGGTYKVMKTWPGMPADESGIGPADLVKFRHFAMDSRADTIYFDVSVKSLNSGYLERTMRMNLSLEMNNLL